MSRTGQRGRVRLSDRTLGLLIGVAALALATAIGFAVWINSAPALHPVPVVSRPSA